MAKSKDFDLRACLVQQLMDEGIPRKRIRHEITLDTSSSGGRADVVVLSDSGIRGYELKSGSDTLDRLAQQVQAYCQAFDHTHLIIDKSHFEKLRAQRPGKLDAFWRSEFYCPRKGAFVKQQYLSMADDAWNEKLTQLVPTVLENRRSGLTSAVSMARLLWREEVLRVALELGYSGKTRMRVIDWLAENGCLRDLRPLVMSELRERPLSKWEQQFWMKFDQLITSQEAA